MKPLVIYVAGPYSGEQRADVVQNVVDACRAGKAILDRGHFPFIPHTHTDFFDEAVAGMDYEDYMRWDDAILQRCDALFSLGPSPGADRERERAEALGLPVYTSLEDIPSEQ